MFEKMKSEFIKSIQEDITTVFPENTNTNIEVKYLSIRDSLKMAVFNESTKNVENDVVVFEGHLSPSIYNRNIFLNQLTKLFSFYFSYTIQENLIIEFKDDEIYYNIENHITSSNYLEYFNTKLQSLRYIDNKKPDFFYKKDSLMEYINNIYTSHKNLIIVSQSTLNKDNIVLKYNFFEKRNINKLLILLETNNHLNEVIQHDVPIKPFFDLDAELELTFEEQQNKLLTFIHFLKNEIFTLYEISSISCLYFFNKWAFLKS